jgi:hypothetical protein
VLLEALVLIIMRERKYDLPDKTLLNIQRTSLCFVIFSLVDLVKTLGCRLLSLRVNAESLFDLLKVRTTCLWAQNAACNVTHHPALALGPNRLHAMPRTILYHLVTHAPC